MSRSVGGFSGTHGFAQELLAAKIQSYLAGENFIEAGGAFGDAVGSLVGEQNAEEDVSLTNREDHQKDHRFLMYNFPMTYGLRGRTQKVPLIFAPNWIRNQTVGWTFRPLDVPRQ